jgi:hypothetical protein
VPSRETVHHAAQLLALAGASYLPTLPDDSHTSMSWLEPAGALTTQPLVAATSLRFGLRVNDLTLITVEDVSDPSAVFPLDRRTRKDALEWMRSESRRHGLDGDRLQSRLHYTISPHPTDDGHPFQRATDGTLDELARWYGHASAVLEERRRSTVGAGPVRCWPHHFDIATLVDLPAGATLQTIGIGLSPGDENCPEPYYYVSPYPAPGTLPRPLSIGSWHTTGWWGAALVGSEVVKQPTAAEQTALVAKFIDESVARLLESVATQSFDGR